VEYAREMGHAHVVEMLEAAIPGKRERSLAALKAEFFALTRTLAPYVYT
jgi:hypothetical protein